MISDGIYQEFKIAEKIEKTLIPVGCTSYTSKCLWEYVDKLETNLYSSERLNNCWNDLNSKSISQKNEVINAIIELIEYRNIQKRGKLERDLLHAIGGRNIKKELIPKVFLSFHYDSSHDIASELRTLINETGKYIATEEEKIKQRSNTKVILSWIDQKLENTFATLLVYDPSIFDSKFVEYEICSSLKRNNTIIVMCSKDDLDCGREELFKRYLLDDSNTKFCIADDVMSKQGILKLLKNAEIERKEA